MWLKRNRKRSRATPTYSNSQATEALMVLGLVGLLGGLALGLAWAVPLLWPVLARLTKSSILLLQILLAGLAETPTMFTGPLWVNLLWDAGFGLLVGFLLGLVASRRRPWWWRKALLDAVLNRNTVGALPLGATSVAAWILAGLLSGAVVGALGLFQPPQLFSGDWQALDGTPALELLKGAGFLGGGGAPENPSVFMILLVLGLVIIAGSALLSALIAVGLGTVAVGIASGAVAGMGRSWALGFAIVLTNRWPASRLYSIDVACQSVLRRHWPWCLVIGGLKLGAWTGLVQTIVTVVCILVAG